MLFGQKQTSKIKKLPFPVSKTLPELNEKKQPHKVSHLRHFLLQFHSTTIFSVISMQIQKYVDFILYNLT